MAAEMNPMGRPASERAFDPWALWQVVRRRWVWVLGFVSGTMVAAILASLFASRQYQAVALIHLLSRAGQEVAFNETLQYDPANYLEGRERARTQLQIILSRGVREEVLQRYVGLGYDDYSTDEAGLERFARNLSAGPREDTQLVEIRVVHTDPERAATLANLVAEVYRERNLEARREAARETKLWLESRNLQIKGKVDEAGDALLRFKSSHDMIDAGEPLDGISERLSTLQRTHSETVASRVQAESRSSDFRRLAGKGDWDLLAGMIDDPTLLALARERAVVVARDAEIQARYGDQHPESRRSQSHRERVEAALIEQVNRNVEAERSKANMLRRQEQQLAQEIDRVKQELLEKQRLQDEFEVLRAEHERARKVYESLGERGSQVELQAHTQLNDVRIVDWAVPPLRPFKPNVPLNLALGLFVGLGGGVGLALLAHRFDETLRDAAEVESALGLRVLAEIPSFEQDGVGQGLPPGMPAISGRALHTWVHPRSFAAEAFRGLRTALQARVGRGPSTVIVVSSLLEGEGKSTTAMNLAIAVARLGHSVLLIEGDLRAPRMHQVFEVPDRPGLSDLLEQEGDPAPFIRPSQIRGVSLLLAGSPVEQESELVGSEAMERLLRRLREQYRIIVVDSPPAMLLTDAAHLAAFSDGLLLVVRSGRVQRSQAVGAVQRLRDLSVPLLGVVLNDVPLPRDARRYGLERAREATAARPTGPS